MFLRAVRILALAVALDGCSGVFGNSEPAAQSGATASKEQMESWWKLYQAGDANWPAARQRWAASGKAARTTLILSLVRELVATAGLRNQDGSLAQRRPQAQLLALPADEVIPVLIETIRIGKHATVLDALSMTLAETGRDDAVVAALESPREGDATQAPATLLRTLVRIGGAHALSAVEKQLTSASDWQLRSSAAESFRLVHASDKPIAIKSLALALDDSDGFVVRTALKSLQSLADVHGAPYVARAYEKIAKSGDAETRKEAIATLRALTGRVIEGNDPKRWLEIATECVREADAANP